MKKVKVTPVPLYKNISGRSLFKSNDPAFREYRRRWREQPVNFEAGDFPLFIDIEVTNACNLRCSFCATTYLDASKRKQFIPAKFVRKILDEGKHNGLYGVKFNDRGEPLLHPELTQFVRYAKKCGLIDVYFNTNGMLLSEAKAKGLINSGLDRISISIEGFRKDFYERYRIKAKFETLLRNVRNLWALRQKRGLTKPLIRIQSVLLPEISKDMDGYLSGYKKFWGPYADEISVIEYKKEISLQQHAKPLIYPWACHQLWQRVVVWCDGTILPCNEDYRGLLDLGNISTTSIKEAWNSKALIELRAVHMAGKSHTITACRGCYLRETQIDKLKKLDKER
ncbi:radical SAM protein [bacterium]|nr:MAG: radical SAM protein [bacterium]